MPGVIQHRRAPTASLPEGLIGELIINTDDWSLRVEDGVTAAGWIVGGFPLSSHAGVTTYDVLPSDQGSFLTFSDASPVAVALPAPGDASNFPDGAHFVTANFGSGTVTFTPASGTINSLTSFPLLTGAAALILSDGTDYWALLFAGISGTTLAGLADVSITSPTNGQVLTYNSGSAKWDNAAPSGGPLVTVTKTAAYNITTGDNGTHFDNIGATGAVPLTLPAAAAGLHYSGAVYASHSLSFVAQSGEYIALGVTNSASGGNVALDTPFAFISIEAHGTGQWVVSSATGSWVVT